jgi:DNA topoisomerase-2
VCFEVYYEKSAQVVGVPLPEAFASDFPDEDPLQLLWIYRLRLFSRINLCNMYLYVGNELKKFSTVPEILTCFAIQRLQKYAERKEYLLRECESALVYVQERRRFLELVLSGGLVIFNKPREEVHKLLLEHGFQKKNDSFDYCVKMPIDSLTRDKLDALHKEIGALTQQLEHVKSQSPQDMWMQELQEWRETYESGTSASAKKKTSEENCLKRRQTSEKNQAKTKKSRAPLI